MATEHEYKYLISLDFAKDFPHERMQSMCHEHRSIEQGVVCHGMGMNLRIRKSIIFSRTQWYMTFKLKDAQSDRLIEVENLLDARDGEDLWRNCYWKLRKDRYVFMEDDKVWEIDFFNGPDGIYFILAEIELMEGSPRPSNVPTFIKDYVVHEVALTDDRFSNKRLGDLEYAKKVYSNFNKSHGETNGQSQQI